MEQREFLGIIKAFRRKLNWAEFLKILMMALLVGAGVGIVFQVISLFMPLYYANLYSVLALVLSVITAGVWACMKPKSMEQTALVMDSFGFQERIITAYENLDMESPLAIKQREDAMKRLREGRERIKITCMPSWKRVLLAVGAIAVMVGLVFVPSDTRQQAKELHQIRKEAKEKEKEIEEVLEELEALENQELTPEQLAALQEMMESLQSSMAEFEQATSGQSLTTAGTKLDYKYANMSMELANMAQSLQSGAMASPMSAETMAAMSDKLKQMSGNAGQMASGQSGGQNGNGQNGNGQSGNDPNGQNGTGQNGNGQNGTGQNGSGQNGSGQNGNGANGTGNNGTGNGGSGSGGGAGRGMGSVNNARDYVSVPNAIADMGNLTGAGVNHDNSQYFRAPNGMNWEGTPVSYQSVIGSYEKNAYEGIATGQYPSGMEDVIKEYFASFN